MKRLKIYLDTSVPNAYYDTRNLERQQITKRFWKKLNEYQIFISDLTIEEIKATGDVNLRQNLLNLIKEFKQLSSNTEEVNFLARQYVTRGIIPSTHIEDAIHIAVASISLLDILVSWNFEHIVKLKTKREVNVVNVLLGYHQIEIIEPAIL